jgi:hypothetical protein
VTESQISAGGDVGISVSEMRMGGAYMTEIIKVNKRMMGMPTKIIIDEDLQESSFDEEGEDEEEGEA